MNTIKRSTNESPRSKLNVECNNLAYEERGKRQTAEVDGTVRGDLLEQDLGIDDKFMKERAATINQAAQCSLFW